MTDYTGWTRNVRDEFQDMETEDIRKQLLDNAMPFSILASHVQGDFNLGTVIRNANAFGARSIFYHGRRRYDRRATVGTHHYVDLRHLKDEDEIMDVLKAHFVVCFETGTDSIPLDEVNWDQDDDRDTLLVFGEETSGIPDYILRYADLITEIPQIGSVRSLNVGVASGIAMYDFSYKNV